MPISKKTKFGRKTTEDEEPSCRFDEKMDLKTIMICTFFVFLEMFYYFSNFTIFFQVKRNGGKLSGGRERIFVNRGKAESEGDPYEGNKA